MAWTSKETVRRLFRLRKPAPDDGPKLDRLRAEFEALALTILELTPGNADQSAAIRQLRQALQWSIAAVVCAPALDPVPDPVPEPSPNAYLSPPPPLVTLTWSQGRGAYQWGCPTCRNFNCGRHDSSLPRPTQVWCSYCNGWFAVSL